LSTAAITLVLKSPPSQGAFDNVEVLNAFAQTPSEDPIDIQLRVRTNSPTADPFSKCKAGDRLLITGEMILEEKTNLPIIFAKTLCPASQDQYINDVVIVGNLGKEGKVSGKGTSIRRALVVDRYVKPSPNTEVKQIADWYQLRGFQPWMMPKLEKIPKGSLCEITGMLWPMKTSEGLPYVEVRCRTIRVHKRSGSRQDPAKQTSASGYSTEDFSQPPDASADFDDFGSQEQWS
jgi:hypothetical protein